MFTKNILVAGVAAAALGVGTAQSAAIFIDADGHVDNADRAVVSVEGASAATIAQSPAFNVKLTSEMLVGDTVVFTMSGCSFDATNAPSTANIAQTGTAGNTLALLSVVGNVVTYRVTAKAGTFINGLFQFPAGTFKLVATGFSTPTAAAACSLGFTSLTDTVAASDLIQWGTQQFAATVTKPLNGIVDVTNGRKIFTAGNDTILTDVGIVTITESATVEASAPIAALDAASTVTWSGDFSWMYLADLSALRTGYTIGATDAGTTLTPVIAADRQSIVATVDQIGAVTLTLTVPAAASANSTQVIPTAAYTVATDLKYNVTEGGGTEAFGGGSQTDVAQVKALGTAGSFTLNATSVTVYSMPFSSTVTPFLWVSNGSATAGTVTATITHDGTTSSEYALGSVAPLTSKHLATALMSAAGAAYPTTGRGNITVTSTSSKTKVSGGYKVGDDRASLENSDTLNSDQVNP